MNALASLPVTPWKGEGHIKTTLEEGGGE